MSRSTLARHRAFHQTGRFARTSPEGGGGGQPGGGTGGGGGQPGTGGGSGGGGQSGTGPGADGGNTGGGTGGTSSGEDLGFPANTPWTSMNPTEQVNYWRHHSRQHEQRANQRADYDDVKRRAELYDEMLRATETPSDKQLREAREAGEAAARSEAQTSEVQNLLRVSLQARGVKPEDLQDLVTAANPSAFVVDGKVSADKVSTYAARITGGGNGTGQQQPGFGGGNGMGQGHFPAPPADRRQAGVAEAQRRFGNRARSAAQAGTTT